MHQIFDNNEFRTKYFKSIKSDYVGFDFQEYKKQTVDNFISTLKAKLDIKRVLDSVL